MQENSSTKTTTAKRTGQVIKRGKDKYLIRVFLYQNAEGKKFYYSRIVKGSKKDAEQVLTDYLQKKNVGVLKQRPSDRLLGEFAEDFLTNISSARRRNRELDIYKLKRYINPHIGHVKLKDITSLHIENLLKELKQGISERTKKPLSGTTRRHIYAILIKVLGYAVNRRHIIENPLKGVVAPKNDSREMNTLSPEEVQRFLQTIDNSKTNYSNGLLNRVGAMFHLAIELGLRPEEYFAIQWKDIDFGNPTLLISASLQIRRVVIRSANTNDWWWDEPKTAKSKRSVPLSDVLVSRLKKHRANLEEWKEKAKKWTEHDLVFSNNLGAPLYPDSIRKLFKKILESAEVDSSRYRLYDLRHTCASLLLRANVHPKVVSERLGHSSVAITLDIYSHCVPAMQMNATQSIAGMIYK
jgi:integrase